MNQSLAAPVAPHILLTGVFGPFGVDDQYGRKENVMELFHNQVTKAQGTASFRFHHRSFGLYFIAENIDAEVTVLDFPSLGRFVQEIRKHRYDVVGISFIAPNFVKAREMARLVRLHSPDSQIVLGGHGAAIEGVEELIDCDHVARGEGISWMRRFLGQDPHAPLVHPVLPSAERESILGVPLPGTFASLLAPGVGCVNACKFCSTSHFFGKAYTPFLSSGKQLFETARRIADERGSDDFFVMDENFLKDKERALELLDEMERHQRFFTFRVFSSAEAILAFGVDNLVRLGVTFLWLGAESASMPDTFAKNRGVDVPALVRSLRDRGILVLASGILCMEHHTPDNIQQDIDYIVGLEADFVQFMHLIPLPVTALYQDMKERGLLRDELPYEEWHGQKKLSWKHPHFPDDQPERWLERAFRQDYEVNSSSMYRVIETSLRGLRHLRHKVDRDRCLTVRAEQFERQLAEYAHMLPVLIRHGVNELERGRAKELQQRVHRELGSPTLVDRVKRAAVRGFAAWWRWRSKRFGDVIQPKTIVTRYQAEAPSVARLETGSGETVDESVEQPAA